MRQLTYLRQVFKLESKMLKEAKWNLTLSLEECVDMYPNSIVYISESQIIRWLDELTGRGDTNKEIRRIKNRLNRLRKSGSRDRTTKAAVRNASQELRHAIFVPEYITVVMANKNDYYRANEGFVVNGKQYRRLLGTNGGIKKSTIVYIQAEYYDEIKKRIDNGRDKTKEIVPAKLEAYQGLTCSSSTPLPKPKGFIVVSDCFTTFKENVITINDENDGEPELKFVEDYQIEHNNSDGFGLMTPEYARRCNKYIEGIDEPLAGMNTRWAWEKGMLCTFDFVHFAEVAAGGNYYIKDVWGDTRDVRDADVILTESMLKLWDSYESMEHYIENCENNRYEFSVTKTCPEELEQARNLNYQFIQSYNLSDSELRELCDPTIEEIKDIMGDDFRKTLIFLAGKHISESQVLNGHIESSILGLMIDPLLIQDDHLRTRVKRTISSRIDECKKGSIMAAGNFAMLFGDPYALAQHIFGLEVTGLLKPGEIYHQYWMDRNVDQVACYRAPMTCHNNIKVRTICDTPAARHWFSYIKTGMILNAWDSTCDALNGADFDGDTAFTTNNNVLVNNTKPLPTIMCMQRKASKCVPAEEDIIESNILAFNDDIGKVTNHITAMFEKQSLYVPGSPEYKELDYRIMCGQHYQQVTIDRAKGVVAKSMPTYWYRTKENQPADDDTEQEKKLKEFRNRIVAIHKPYFMVYIYPDLKIEYNSYLKSNESHITARYCHKGIYSIDDLRKYEPKTEEMKKFVEYYDNRFPVGIGPCVMNRIADLFEREFK